MHEGCTLENGACSVACDRGDVSACFTHAVMLQQAKRRSDAKQMYERACLAGLSIACVNYGAGLWVEEESAASLGCARRLFEKACEAKDSMGCAMVGRMWMENMPRDKGRAKAHLERTCDELKGPPCRVLAYYLELGSLGPPVEKAQLDALMDRACKGGDDEACRDYDEVDDTFYD